MNTTTTETINGHVYSIERDETNNIICQRINDPVIPIVRPVTLSKTQFRNLFTLNERMLTDNFDTNTSLTTEQKNLLVTLRYELSICESVDLTDPMTIQGTNALESYGLIATGRAALILANTKPA